jgi:glycosyltransferase EpsF
MAKAEAVVAQSQVLKESLSTTETKRVEIISNGIDTQRFKIRSHEEKFALKESLGIPSDKITIINTGRITSGKNLITLVKAVDQLENSSLRDKLYLLILVGKEPGFEDPAETELREYIKERNLSHMVSIRENVDNVENYLSASDIFVLPTYYNEGMSNSGVEAMASGLPMICSELPQVTVTFPPDIGLFFPATDINALAGHIENLVKSTDMREEYGQQLADFAVTNYSNEVLAKRYAELFGTLIADSKAAAHAN